MERNAANHSAYLRAAEAAELLGWEPEEIADPAATDGAYLSTYGVPTVDALSALSLIHISMCIRDRGTGWAARSSAAGNCAGAGEDGPWGWAMSPSAPVAGPAGAAAVAAWSCTFVRRRC